MKLSTRLKRGRKAEWWVLVGGANRHTVAEVLREPVGGVIKFCPYIHLPNPSRDGAPFSLSKLEAVDTLDAAIDVVRSELESRNSIT
jgi:hypothetical protein